MSSPSDPRPPRQPGWVIGHVAGAPVVLAPSSLLAVVVLTAAYAPAVRSATRLGAGAYLVAAVFVVLLFASVLAHELAHGIVAKRRGQQPTAFVLTLWGGHTSFVGGSASPATSALVAVVGPLANLLLAGAFAGLRVVAPSGSLAEYLAWAGALSNGFVGVFNLLPGLPLDGGRLLEAAVWAGTRDRSRGTEVAGWVGRAVAAGLVLLVVVLPLSQGLPPSVFNLI
ncbi:MAG: site-2 protease family protein, partial [Cellulomonas sp.]|nr:site-2 protease family protein [Cellulomonas sp.]